MGDPEPDSQRGSEEHTARGRGAFCQIPGHGDSSASPSECLGPCSGGYTKAWETRSMPHGTAPLRG